MNASILENVVRVNGVHGAAVADHDAAIVTHNLKPPYDPDLISHVVSRLKAATEAVGYIESSPIQTVMTSFDDGVIVTRLVKDVSIVVIASNEANLAMLAVALNAVALKVPDALDKAVGSGPSNGSQSADLSISDSSSSRPAPPDALPKSLIKELLRVFAEQMGPFAKVLLKEQLGALGVSPSTVRQSQWPDLVAMLAAKIPDTGKRNSFMQAARGLSQAPR